MDKYEYKVRLDEIEKLMDKGKYKDAVRLADSIDWQRVKSAMTLVKIAELYGICKRFDACRDLLEFAYDRNPSNKNVIFALCEVSLQFNDIVEAMEYFKQYAHLAPRDTGVYILKYKIYEAQNVGFEDKIELLEELKKKDRIEEWEYELAYLYHRAGLATKCVEECDELILWFGEGPFVTKAMELKMLHEPLTPQQQYKYDTRGLKKVDPSSKAEVEQEIAEQPAKADFNTIEFGNFNTINLQEELAKNIESYIGGEPSMLSETQAVSVGDKIVAQKIAEKEISGNTGDVEVSKVKGNTGNVAVTADDTAPAEEKAVNYREEVYHDTIPADSKEVFFDDKTGDIRYALPQPENAKTAYMPELEVFKEDFKEKYGNVPTPESAGRLEEKRHGSGMGSIEGRNVLPDGTVELEKSFEEPEVSVTTVKPVKNDEIKKNNRNIQEIKLETEPAKDGNSNLDAYFSQNGDGQISLANLPQEKVVEKQITGQINIEDIMADWEKRKQQAGEKFKEDTRKRLLQETGKLFSDFRESSKSGILATLDNPAIIDTVSPSAVVMKGIDDADEFTARELTHEAPIVGSKVSKVIEPEKEQKENLKIGWHEKTGEPFPTAALGTEALAIINEGFTEEMKEAAAAAALAAEAGKISAEVGAEVGSVVAETATEAVAGGVAEVVTVAAEETAGSIWDEVDGKVISSDSKISANISEVILPDEKEEEDSETEAVYEEQSGEETENSEVCEDEASENNEDVNVEETYTEEDSEVSEEEVVGDDSDETDSDEEEDEDSSEGDDAAEESNEASGDFSQEEKSIFSTFLYSSKLREDIRRTIDNISLAAYVGNVLISSDNQDSAVGLAKAFVKYIQTSDGNFSGNVAAIDSSKLNGKEELDSVFEKLTNGALIITGAGSLSNPALQRLLMGMNQEERGIIVFLIDKKSELRKLTDRNPVIEDFFNCRVNLKPMSNDKLIAIAKKYAKSKDYVIDEMAVLAFCKRMSDLQVGMHQVTINEVKEIVDDAIKHASKGGLFGIKKKDEDGYILLREKDFVIKK